MTTTSLARWSASSRYWVVSRTVTPSAARPRISAHTSPRLCGSRPVVGSSRYRTRGRPTRLAARSSRRRMPPEYVFTGRPAASDSSNRSSRLAARARASARPMPSSRPIMIRLFVPLRPSSTEAYCPVRAMSWRTRCASRTTSIPGHAGPAAVGAQQGGQDPYRRGLPGAVGPEQAEHRPGPGGQVRPGQRRGLAEALDQPLGLDRVHHRLPLVRRCLAAGLTVPPAAGRTLTTPSPAAHRAAGHLRPGRAH